MKTDGAIVCWGSDESGQASPSQGRFESVSAGAEHSCGVKTDGAVACWGRSAQGQTTPPQGRFASVGAGYYHTCAARTDGTVACWGSGQFGQATPPQGRFASVSVGEFHNCAVRSDGAVACWGMEDFGQTRPPQGSFASVSAGHQHSCGLNTDGTIACWGRSAQGQTAPPAPLAASPDREALVAFYNATNGPNWATNTNWLSDRPLGEWHGVTTDANGRVVKLELPENEMSGQIPPELGNLTNLTYIDLINNQLSGADSARSRQVVQVAIALDRRKSTERADSA